MEKKGNNKASGLIVSQQRFWKKLWRQKALVLMAAAPVALLIIFQYVPIYGILIAFKDYKPKRGILGSEWNDPIFKEFIRFFKNVNCQQIIINTFTVGTLTLLFTYPAPIIFALMLNELKAKRFKRVAQTASYIPHFISVVVVCTMLNKFSSLGGLFNDIREFLGMARVDMNSGTKYFMWEYIGSALWQGVGWGSIIYLSALSNVDTSLYDVANLDGANRLQKIRHIAWPAIMPTTTTLLIMNAGNVLSVDFQKILLMQNDTNKNELHVLATFIHYQGISKAEFSYSTAINLFQSVVSFIFVWCTNMVVRRMAPENSLW